MSIYQDHASPSIPMTEEQKFFFDLQGWIVLPAVLSDSELNMMKKECYANIDPKDLNQISGGIKDGHSGALQNLLDHPSITGILSEILGDKPYQNETSYGFRCDTSWTDNYCLPIFEISRRSDGMKFRTIVRFGKI